MTPKFAKSSHASRKAATLIELVAGLALLALLVTGLLMTRARLNRQRAAAESRLRATSLADELLSGWQEKPNSFPRQSHGICSDSQFTWHTRPISNSTAASLHLQIIRLEIAQNDQMATNVDVVLHDEEFATTSP